MTKQIDLRAKCEDELTMIDNVIKVYEKELADLRIERCRILSKMKALDMSDVLECIENSGLSAQETLNLIIAAVKGKKRRRSVHAC